MKPSLPSEELIEHWILLPHERTWVLDSVRNHNRRRQHHAAQDQDRRNDEPQRCQHQRVKCLAAHLEREEIDAVVQPLIADAKDDDPGTAPRVRRHSPDAAIKAF